MNPLIASILVGILVIAGSLIVARRLRLRWEKCAVVGIGILLAGIIVLLPLKINSLHSPKFPSDAEILLLLYGEEVSIHESLDGGFVYVDAPLTNIEREQFSYAAQVHTQIVYKENGWNNDPQSLIVLTRTGPPDCCDRSLAPVLGGAVITREDEAWEVAAFQKWITPYRSFDLLVEGAFVEIGPGKVGLVLPDETQSTAVNQAWDLILSEIDGHLKLIVKIETEAENAHQCSKTAEDKACWSYASNYEFIRGNHPEYYEILINTAGTKLMGGLVMPFEETRKLVFSNGSYQLVGE